MAKINTTNYQPVTAWNGTQDLLIVEQSDGTKVATPEQVKQYVEAGDFEATGEVKDGHGNILKDMAKSAVVDAEIATKRSLSVSSSVIGSAVNVANATSTNPYTTPHEGFVRFDGPSCLTVNTYRIMKSSANADYKGMWLPKGVLIYFTDGTPPLAQWFNCSNE